MDKATFDKLLDHTIEEKKFCIALCGCAGAQLAKDCKYDPGCMRCRKPPVWDPKKGITQGL